MSFADLLEAVDHLNESERAELGRRLHARELAGDASRTAEMAARLDRMLAGEGIVTEEELHAKWSVRGGA